MYHTDKYETAMYPMNNLEFINQAMMFGLDAVLTNTHKFQ